MQDSLYITPGAIDALRSTLPEIDAMADGEAITAFCALRDAVQSLLDGDTPDKVLKSAEYHLR